MEIRELVRLKNGLGGLEPPFNVGILLDREKAGRDHLAAVFTLKGTIKVKWKFIKKDTGRIYEGDKNDNAAMTALLGQVIEGEKDRNLLKMDPGQMIETILPADLRRSVLKYISGGGTKFGVRTGEAPAGCHAVAFSPAEIGHIHFSPSTLTPKQVWAIERVLSKCDAGGDADLRRIDIERKPHYSPYTAEAISEVDRHIRLLEDLRSCFLEWVEEEDAVTGKERKVPKLKVEGISTVELPLQLRDEMDRICRWAVSYLENGSWPTNDGELRFTDMKTTGPFGLGGLDVRRRGRFDLERYIEYLSMDLTSGPRGDMPSNLVTMLLLLNRIDWRDASELVVKYHMGSGARKFHEVFQPHVLDVARGLPDHVEASDEAGREDLTGLETYTIDPSDARDFDDAVSISKEGGRTRIWVHIADVSHYVRPGDLVDSEARYRSTSVYLPTRVIPMLPARLSEDLCSLKEGVRRLALSTLMVFDEELNLLEWRHVPSVIRVDANLDYEQVNSWIEEGREPFRSLFWAAEALERKGDRLKIETPEKRIRFTTGSSIDIALKRPTRATRLIEELMVATNECAARYLMERGVPTLFRVHPLPDTVTADKFNAACEALGLDVRIDLDREDVNRESWSGGEDTMLNALLSGGKINFGATSNPLKQEKEEGRPLFKAPSKDEMDRAVTAYNRALEEIGSIGKETLKDMLNIRVLRTLGQAFYSVENIGHFGLRSQGYLHFTSPIRRYPDILVHRAVKACLEEEGAGPFVGWHAPERDELEGQMEHTNDMSGSADEWERDMVSVALSTRARMETGLFKGPHSGIITSLTGASCYVLLDDGVTEGRLSLRDMSPYPLTIDENESMIMVDLRSASDPRFRREVSQGLDEAVFLKLGDRITCRISAVSIASGRIDLKISS